MSAPPRLALALGWAGVLPFVGCAALALAGPEAWRALAAQALLAYGATIVSFLGGLHWGFAMRGPAEPARLAWGVLPSLLAWPALLLPPAAGLALLTAALALCYAVDHRAYPRLGLAPWLGLRRGLSAVAIASCGAVALVGAGA
ncbi:MAG: hypothetical protein Fur0014_19940 [Rubrivivax sp.]